MTAFAERRLFFHQFVSYRDLLSVFSLFYSLLKFDYLLMFVSHFPQPPFGTLISFHVFLQPFLIHFYCLFNYVHSLLISSHSLPMLFPISFTIPKIRRYLLLSALQVP